MAVEDLTAALVLGLEPGDGGPTDVRVGDGRLVHGAGDQGLRMHLGRLVADAFGLPQLCLALRERRLGRRQLVPA